MLLQEIFDRPETDFKIWKTGHTVMYFAMLPDNTSVNVTFDNRQMVGQGSSLWVGFGRMNEQDTAKMAHLVDGYTIFDKKIRNHFAKGLLRDRGKQSITGQGNSIKVFSTVIAAIKHFLDNNSGIDEIEFAAESDPSRVKLYDRFVNTLGRQVAAHARKWRPEFDPNVIMYTLELKK